MEKKTRQIVIPGETIVSGNEYLPGFGAYRDGEEVVASVYGVVFIDGKQVRVNAVSGAYYPRRGNAVIGTIVDITFNGWLIDFGGAQNAFLPVSEVPRYINKNEMREFLDFGDSVIVKVWDVKSRGVDVSMKMRGFGKIEEGVIIKIGTNQVPRVIGKEGSMIRIIKEATGCEITVGQNGKVWLRGKSIDMEIAAKKIIEFVASNTMINGLTEKVGDLIKKMGLVASGGLEIIEEDTSRI
jgi:exosome complex component RRP4